MSIPSSSRSIPSITIGVLPKEKFSLAAECIERILHHTTIPFQLIIVNPSYPAQYWTQVESIIAGRDNVQVVEMRHYISPNESRNLIIENTSDQYVCLFENDTLVEGDWLPPMLRACDDNPNSAVIPLLFEGPQKNEHLHVDWKMGRVTISHENEKIVRVIQDGNYLKRDYGTKGVVELETVELHVVLAKRTTFLALGKFDDSINTREHYDFMLMAQRAGVPIILQPESKMSFYQAPTVNHDELESWDYFWNFEKGMVSNKFLREKWNLRNYPNSFNVIKAQQYRQDPLIWNRYLKGTLPKWFDFLVVPADHYITEESQGETWLVIDQKKRWRLNHQASVIVGMMNGERTLGDIILELRSAYSECKEMIFDDVYCVYKALIDAGALTSIPLPAPEQET